MNGFFPSYDAASAYLDSIEIYKNSDGLVGFIGEWYNYIFRNRTFDKIPFGSLSSWLAAH